MNENEVYRAQIYISDAPISGGKRNHINNVIAQLYDENTRLKRKLREYEQESQRKETES